MRRVEEAVSRCAARGISWCSSFLDERQQLLAEAQLSRMGWQGYRFFGGSEASLRRLLQVFEGEPPSAPIVCLDVLFPEKIPLTHRDFLGALMSLGMKRELLGDIFVQKGCAKLFVTGAGRQIVEEELTSVGKAAVAVRESQELPTACSLPEEEIRATVASLRLDAVLSAALRKSRTAVSQLISGGQVAVSARTVVNASFQLEEGALISVRGVGKFRLTKVGGQSKKDRTFISIEKF